MRMRAVVLAMMGALILLGAATSAEARRYDWSDEDDWEEAAPRRVPHRHRAQPAQHESLRAQPAQRETQSPRIEANAGNLHAVGPRPGAWCGWWMRTRRGGGPEYNLAWTWSRWGKSSGPQVGAVVVWRHHVGEITGRTKGGQWIVRSGNDGGRVRERPRSVAGAVFRIGNT